MRVTAALVAAALVGAVSLSAVPWAALVERVRVPEPWDGPTVRVVVAPGDSLWSLARRYRAHRDPRQVVDWIRAANRGLDPGRLQVGAVIEVPVQSVEMAEGVR